MAETRRTLFKTSVISALGLMSCAQLAQEQSRSGNGGPIFVHGICGSTFGPLLLFPVTSSGGQTFKVVAISTSNGASLPSPPLDVTNAIANNGAWIQTPVTGSTIVINGQSITTDSMGLVVVPQSSSGLQSILSWNEIGRQ